MASPELALVRREFLSMLRRRGPFRAVGATVGLGILIATLSWPTHDLMAGAGAAAGYNILISLSALLLLATMIVVPGLAAGSIASERDEDTFALLRLTLVRPSGILGAKLINSSGIVLLILMAMVPILSVVMFIQGVDLGQLGATVFVLLITSVACAAIGVACAAVYRSTSLGLRATYALVFCYSGLPLYVFAGMGAAWNATYAYLFLALMVYTPPGALAWAMFRAPMAGTPFATTLLSAPVGLAIYSAVVAVLCLLVARNRLFRTDLAEAVPVESPRERKKRLAQPLPKTTYRSGWRAVMRKEVREAQAGRRWAAGFAMVAVAILAIVINVTWVFGMAGFYRTYSWRIWVPILALMSVPVLLAPGTTAGLLTRERERDTLSMLRTTLLTPREVVLGKAAAGFLMLRPIFLGILAPEAVMLLIAIGSLDGLSVAEWFMGAVTLLATVSMVIAAGVFASATSPRTGHAMSGAFVLTFFILILIPVGAFLFPNLIFRSKEFVSWLVCSLSPPYAYGNLSATLPRSLEMTALQATLCWVASLVFAGGMTALLLYGAIRTYAAQLRKDEQGSV